jgi:hypothetical protein
VSNESLIPTDRSGAASRSGGAPAHVSGQRRVLSVALQGVADEHLAGATWALESLLGALGIPWRTAAGEEQPDIGYGCPARLLELPYVPAAWRMSPGSQPEGDELALAFWWLARVEELHPRDDQLDQRGRFRARASAWTGGLTDAPVDRIVARWREQLRAELGGAWPGTHGFALALTHDIDLPSWWTPRATRRALRRARYGDERWAPTLWTLARTLGWKATGADPCCNAAAIARLEARYGARSTSYMLNGFHAPADGSGATYERVANRYRDDALAGGGVIGLHGSYTSSAVPGRLAAEQADLVQATGSPVPDHRFHYLRHLPARDWPLVAAAGMTSDSSLGYVERPGFRAGFSFPYRAWNHELGRPIDLVVVPLAFMDATLEPRHLDLDPASPAARELVDELLAYGAANGSGFSILFHNDKLAPAPGSRRWARLYEYLLGRARDLGAWQVDTGSVATAWSRARTAPHDEVAT